MRTLSIKITSLVALIAAACGTTGPTAEDLNDQGTPSAGMSGSGGTGGTDVTSGGTGAVATGGTGAVATGGTGAVATGGTGAVTTGGTGGMGAAPTGGTGGDVTVGGTGGAPVGGSAGSGMETGGAAGAGNAGGAGASGGSGGSGGGPAGPYDARSGTFKMLVYSRTVAFRHTDSINTGKTMLQQIATEQGFTITATEANTDITPTGLAQYEVVFFMNPTGDIFNATEQQVFEDWMTTKNGGFAGVHSATDTENGWAFYSEVTGQYYDLHEPCCSQASIQWDPGASGHVAVTGLPSPWQRSEEWYNFNRNAEWSVKPGFQILSRVTVNNVARPVSYTRQWGNFRAFYTSLGHQGSVFQDANVKKHVAAGIMWAARREALLR